jgi:hypothetical protein
MSLRLPYAMAAICIAFLLGLLSRRNQPLESESSVKRDSSFVVTTRSDTVRMPAIHAAIVKGRELRPNERDLLPSQQSTDSSPPFAIDTILCEDDLCDTVKGFVLPASRLVLDLEIRHSPVITFVHDTIIKVHSETAKQQLLSLTAGAAYEAFGLERDFALRIAERLRVGQISILVSPEISLAHGPSIWAGLEYHIY